MPAEEELSRARLALQRVLAKLRRAAPESARETLVQALCDGLRTIPVPLVGAFLARLAEDSLKPESVGPDLEDLLDRLEQMQGSDEQFAAGLEMLGADVDQLLGDLRAIRETQVGTAFRIARPRIDANWPISDNHISALLLNRGGGLVVLDEIRVEVERCSTDVRADLTVPAAPLNVIYLKATLDVGTPTYPLFELNDEPPHQFAQGLGAERLEIDLESRQNASYLLRLHLAYYDAEADADRELAWPQPPDAPIELRFPWAPGWRPDMELLNRDAVFDDIAARVEALASWFRDGGGPEELEPIGIPQYMATPYLLERLIAVLKQDALGGPFHHQELKTAIGRLEQALSGEGDGRRG